MIDEINLYMEMTLAITCINLSRFSIDLVPFLYATRGMIHLSPFRNICRFSNFLNFYIFRSSRT